MEGTSKRPPARGNRKRRPLAFPVEFRLRIVKLHLEEGYRPQLIAEQFGIRAVDPIVWTA
jgi:transposase-like protein